MRQIFEGCLNNYYGKDILLGLKSTTMKNTDIVTAWDSPVSHIMQHLCHTKRKKKKEMKACLNWKVYAHQKPFYIENVLNASLTKQIHL